MNSSWRDRLIYIGAAVCASIVGILIAQGGWILVSLIGVAIGGLVLGALAPTKTHYAVFVVLILGYILGNRGFAQLSPMARVPFFPAEIGLALSGGLLLAQCTPARRLPFHRDSLNFTLLIWIMVAGARIGFDVRSYGFTAIRDFAMVYYAAFFFITQSVFSTAANPARWLHRWLLLSTAILFPLYFVVGRFPDFFLHNLTLRGSPLIYFKGDLVGTYLAIGAVVWFLFYEQARHRWWAWGLSMALAGSVLTTDNRSSVLALLAAAVWLGIGGRWRFFATLTAAGTAAVIGLLLWVTIQDQDLSDTPLHGVYEKVVSLTDPFGERNYTSASSFSKGDNNRFRFVWWQTVIEETWQKNPYAGVGFGYDLAGEFLKTYYPDSGDDFTVRSPHNILVTIFARMGAFGFLAFSTILVAFAARTREAVSLRHDPEFAAPWCTCWAILTSACFGVVLEGPMGAVLFWMSLGIGSAAVIKYEGVPENRLGSKVAERLEDRPLTRSEG